jgi:hypothetical protein
MHIDDLMDTQPAHLGSVDVCLMDAVAPTNAYKPAAKDAFNRVRLYLGVTYLSKIATADGHSIARDAWTGTRPRRSPFLWPYQPCPGMKSFRNWRRILADIFLSGCWTSPFANTWAPGYPIQNQSGPTGMPLFLPAAPPSLLLPTTAASTDTQPCAPVDAQNTRSKHSAFDLPPPASRFRRTLYLSNTPMNPTKS